MSRNWTTIKEYTDITFGFFEGIAKITINRPEVHNAFRPETNKEMIDAMDLAREDPRVGVVERQAWPTAKEHTQGIGQC